MPSCSSTREQSIHAALALANSRRHELATLEHLLLALIDEPDNALKRGVFGAPSFIVDEELFWGKDRMEFIADALQAVD